MIVTRISKFELCSTGGIRTNMVVTSKHQTGQGRLHWDIQESSRSPRDWITSKTT